MENIEDKVIKASIPDDDMMEWFKILRESGMKDEQIDEFFVYLNKEYRNLKGKEVYERRLEDIENFLREKYNKTLTEEKRDYLRKMIEKKFN